MGESVVFLAEFDSGEDQICVKITPADFDVFERAEFVVVAVVASVAAVVELSSPWASEWFPTFLSVSVVTLSTGAFISGVGVFADSVIGVAKMSSFSALIGWTVADATVSGVAFFGSAFAHETVVEIDAVSVFVAIVGSEFAFIDWDGAFVSVANVTCVANAVVSG